MTGKLTEDINLIRENFYGFIESTKGNVIVLSDAIEKLSEAAKSNEESNEQISNNLNSVASNAGSQLGLVRDNLKLIESDHEQLGSIEQSIGRVPGGSWYIRRTGGRKNCWKPGKDCRCNWGSEAFL